MKRWGVGIMIVGIFFGLSFGVFSLVFQSAEIRVQNDLRSMDKQMEELSDQQEVLDVELDRLAKEIDLERVAEKLAMDYPSSQQEVMLAMGDGISAYDGVVLAARR